MEEQQKKSTAEVLVECLKEEGVDIIVTVDNGIKAYENEIERLKAAKWKAEKEDVLHHLYSGKLPLGRSCQSHIRRIYEQSRINQRSCREVRS